MILTGNEVNTLPRIIYDEIKGLIFIEGRSVSVEVDDYFEEFLAYFEEYITKNPSDLTFNIEFEYFNTITCRAMLKLFKIAKKVEDDDFKVVVNWIGDDDDDDMMDAGYDFESISGLKFNYIRKPEKTE